MSFIKRQFQNPALAICWLALLLIGACSEDYLPKPKGYNRIDLPKRDFVSLNKNLPYNFEHSVHAQIERDSFNLQEKTWTNVHYTDLDARVHLTYKAYGIDEAVVLTPRGYTGFVSELSGEVPTQFQFFVTDSTQHFLRGALYFQTAVKNDSLAPIIEYIKIDMMHLINTLTF